MSDTKGDGFGKEAHEFGPRPGLGYRKPEAPARADFKKWARRDLWHIAEGAMLILRFEPFDVKAHSWPKGPEGFDDIYETAIRSLNNEVLRASPMHWVSPSDFLAWAREKEYHIPEEIEEAVNRFQPKTQSRYQGGAGGPKWPWGSHDTKLLRDLGAAAERFWKNYDPSDPTTAPTNRWVIDWLKERGVSERTAGAMATILRADGLPTGPRK